MGALSKSMSGGGIWRPIDGVDGEHRPDQKGEQCNGAAGIREQRAFHRGQRDGTGQRGEAI
jgi:hypothetical protein